MTNLDLTSLGAQVWPCGGAVVLVAFAALLAWLVTIEKREESRTQARIQQRILGGEFGIPAPVARPLVVPVRLAAGNWEPDADSVPWAHDHPLPPLVPPPLMAVPAAEMQELSPLQADAAAAAVNASQGETYCPACLCVALENHQGYDREAWQQDIYVPLGAVVTAGMLDFSARPVACAHHARAYEHLTVNGRPMTRTEWWTLAAGLERNANRLVAKVRRSGGEGTR